MGHGQDYEGFQDNGEGVFIHIVYEFLSWFVLN